MNTLIPTEENWQINEVSLVFKGMDELRLIRRLKQPVDKLIGRKRVLDYLNNLCIYFKQMLFSASKMWGGAAFILYHVQEYLECSFK